MKMTWKEELQLFVDDVIELVYQWPAEKRSTIRILQLIERKQKQLNLSNFPDFGCYYLQLAQIIDHLLQQTIDHKPDLSWFCKYWETFELEEKLTLNHVVIEEYKQQRTFKKFVIERKPKEVERYRKSAIQCSYHMFHELPDRIETFHLLTGESYIEWTNPHSLTS